MILPPRPRVSVIIPCYNYGRYLPEAVASVQAQTLTDLEIIIVDDGSTDETPEVIAGLAEPRLRRRRTENRGVSGARNAGLDMARGDFVAFLDADDRWRSDKLARQVAIMDAEPDVALVFTDLRRFSPDGALHERQFDFVPELSLIPTRPAYSNDGLVIVGDAFVALAPLPQLPAWIQTDLFRASVTRDLRFDEQLRLAEDFHFILRAYLRGDVAYIAEPMADVRRHDSNSYMSHADMLAPVIESLALLGDLPLGSDHRRALMVREGRAWLALGYHHFWEGSPWTAARAYSRALLYSGDRLNALAHAIASPLAPLFRRLRRPMSQRRLP